MTTVCNSHSEAHVTLWKSMQELVGKLVYFNHIHNENQVRHLSQLETWVRSAITGTVIHLPVKSLVSKRIISTGSKWSPCHIKLYFAKCFILGICATDLNIYGLPIMHQMLLGTRVRTVRITDQIPALRKFLSEDPVQGQQTIFCGLCLAHQLL